MVPYHQAVQAPTYKCYLLRLWISWLALKTDTDEKRVYFSKIHHGTESESEKWTKFWTIYLVAENTEFLNSQENAAG